MEEAIVEKIRKKVRVKSEESKDEIADLADACVRELELAGVYEKKEDPLYLQALILYCKAHYGYDEDTQRFRLAFEKLRDAMALSGDYRKGQSDGNS